MFVVRTGNGDDPARGASTGAAWLSSARVVRCWVKSRNERNPCLMLPARYGGGSGETARGNSGGRGGGRKASCPLFPGAHPYLQGPDQRPRCPEVGADHSKPGSRCV